MGNEWKMDQIHNALVDLINDTIEANELPIDQITNVFLETVNEAVPKVGSILLSAIKQDAPRKLRKNRRTLRGFRGRNEARWKEGFDLLEMLIVISSEIGAAIKADTEPDDVNMVDYKLEAVVTLHARALLVSREILCLMTNGFADGALGRWRTLHEVAVVASLLAAEDQSISERYLLSRDVHDFKSAIMYRKHEEGTTAPPLDEEEFQALEEAYHDIVTKYGKEMKRDWGWALPILKEGKKEGYTPTFSDLEKRATLDHWRYRYKWASGDTHGNHRPNRSMLAAVETEDDVLFVGESNSGMVEPAHMMAISLLIATVALIRLEPNVDRLVSQHVMELLTDEVGEMFPKVEKETLERHRRRQGRSLSNLLSIFR